MGIESTSAPSAAPENMVQKRAALDGLPSCLRKWDVQLAAKDIIKHSEWVVQFKPDGAVPLVSHMVA